MCAPRVVKQKKGECDNNAPGLQVTGYFAFYEDILTWPTFDPDGATPQERKVYVGDFVMVANRHFIPVWNTEDKGFVEGEATGPTDGRQFRVNTGGFVPGLDEDRTDFADQLLNANCVYLGIDKNDQIWVVGQPGVPAKMSLGKLTTGAGPEDLRGFEFNLSYTGRAPMKYVGTIPFNDSSNTTPPTP